MSGEEEPGFLGRWSRRKRGVEAEAPSPAEVEAEPAPEPAPVAKSGTCPIPGMEPIDLSTLPPIEELSVTSDLAPFLRPGVPAALRSAALRRMWSLDPAIRDYIGPVEYQWDFNAPGGLPAGFANELIGDVKKLLAQAIGEVAEEKPAEPPLEALPEPPMALAPEPPAMVPPGISLAEAPPAPAPALPAPEPEPDAPPAPRRRHGGALPA